MFPLHTKLKPAVTLPTNSFFSKNANQAMVESVLSPELLFFSKCFGKNAIWKLDLENMTLLWYLYQ